MPDAANRLGIALNFVAGLLLAPQLIGEERLLAFERWTTAKTVTFAHAVQSPIALWKGRRGESLTSASITLGLSAALWVGVASTGRWIRGAEPDLARFWVLWPDALIVLVVFVPLFALGVWVTALDDLFFGGAAALAGEKPDSDVWRVTSVMWKTALFPVAVPFLVLQVLLLALARLLELAASGLGRLAHSLQRCAGSQAP